jgi:catechol 2,3-dioxygenase-like lactoylglutathione lyase family enzyme
MPEVSGLLESSLYVEDLPRAIDFYTDLFGFKQLAGDDRFCALSVCDRSVLLLFRCGCTREPVPVVDSFIPAHDAKGQLHLALAVKACDLEAWEEKLRAKGIAIESRVRWPQGGTSLYFRDLDNHLVELATPGIWAIY